MRAVFVPGSYGGQAVIHRLNYRADIDGLRAIAIVPVLLFHAFPSLLPGGFLGVDVFFVISGFLIASLVLDELGRGKFSIVGFYRRRVRRIFPALAVVLATCLVIGYMGLYDAEFRQLALHALFGAFGMANLSLYRDTGYFSLPAATNAMLHLWSLGVEEQFYLLLPATILLVTRRLTWVLVAALLVSLALCASPGFSDNARFFLPQFRAWELLAGVLLAKAVHHGWRVGAPARHLVSILGLACLAVAFAVVESDTTPLLAQGAAVVGTVALIAAGRTAIANRWILRDRLLVGIGLISYSLYLWHWPLLAFSNIIRPHSDAAFRSGALAVSVVLSVLTYLLVERPARRRVPVISSPWVLTGCMALVAVAAWSVVRVDGQAGWASTMDLMYPTESSDPKCVARFWEQNKAGVVVNCSDPAAAATVALIGDSHAHHLYDGLREYYQAHGQNVVAFSAAGCAPFPEPPVSSRCVSAYQDILQRIDQIGTIKTVIVGEYITFMQGRTRTHWVAEARGMLHRFAARNMKTILMLDVPWMPIDPRVECQLRPLPFALGQDDIIDRCSVQRADYEKRVPAYRHLAAQAIEEIPGARTFDLADKLCSKTSCPAIIDGHVIYRDDNHLNRYGSRYMARFYDWEAPAPVPAQPRPAS